MTGNCYYHVDLSEISLKENYKLDILARFGGKIQYYLKVAAFCDKVKDHYRLRRFFTDYDFKQLHRCMVDILNAAFQELPEAFDLNIYFQERHHKLIDAGMTSSDFDVFVLVYEETLWDAASLDKSLVTDAVRLLHALRGVFDNIQNNRRTRRLLTLWELVERRKRAKIDARRRKFINKQSCKEKKAKWLEESARSDCTEEAMTPSSSEEDQLYNKNWDHAGYMNISWNGMVY